LDDVEELLDSKGFACTWGKKNVEYVVGVDMVWVGDSEEGNPAGRVL